MTPKNLLSGMSSCRENQAHVLFGDMAEGVLDALQKGDEAALLLPVLVQYFREDFFHGR